MTECYIQNCDPDAPVHCGNCQWTGTGRDLEMITDIQERIDPGCEVPAGQCPECRALAYLDKPNDQPKTQKFYVAMTWDYSLETGEFYTTVVTARSNKEAEDLCIQEMMDIDTEVYPDRSLRGRLDKWHVIDCFPLAEFIRNNFDLDEMIEFAEDGMGEKEQYMTVYHRDYTDEDISNFEARCDKVNAVIGELRS